MYIFIFLLSAVGFLLLVFSVHLLFTKMGNRLLNTMLALPLLTRFIQVCVFLIITSPYENVFPYFQKICMPLLFVAPICTYLYVRGFIYGDLYFKKWDLLHLIPVIFAITHIIPFPLSTPINWNDISSQLLLGGQLSIKTRTGIFSAQFYNVVQGIILGGYLIATWYVVIVSGFLKRSSWNINKSWITFYLSSSTFFKSLSFVALIFNYLERSYTTSNMFLLISCIVLLAMMAFVLYHPRILYGYIILSPQPFSLFPEASLNINFKSASNTVYTSKSEKVIDAPVISSKKPIDSIPKSKISAEQIEKFSILIQEHMEKQKPYLLTDFQIKDLCQSIDIPVHHCSHFINKVLNKNFRDWLNSYRIQHFINEYPTLAGLMTIESVAFRSGFKNMTTFYNAFKKEIGQMPSTYFSNKEM